MDFISHTTGGVLLGAGCIYLCRKVNIEPNTIALIGASAFGALLPDIDHPKSFLGSKVYIIPDLLYSFVGHRTLTHSLLFAFIIGAIGLYLNTWIGIGVFIGIISHILLDMLTPSGVSFLYPFKKERIKLR